MKIYIHSKNKPLFRHGNPITEEYAWFSPNYKVALSYGQFKTIKRELPGLVNNRQINAYLARRGNRNIRNNINRHTKRSFPKKLKLVNLRNKNTMNYLLNQLRPNLKTRLLSNNYIRYRGNVVSRKSNFNKNTIIANLITGLKKNYSFNINGFYNKGNRLNEEVVIFNSTMPRPLNPRRVGRVIKRGGPNSFNVWKQRRNNERRRLDPRSAYNVFSSMRPQAPPQPPQLQPQPQPKRPVVVRPTSERPVVKPKESRKRNPLLSFGNNTNNNNNNNSKSPKKQKY